MGAFGLVVRHGLVILALLGLGTATAQAQGKHKHKHKHYAVTSDRAIVVTRTVLVQRGFRIVRVDQVGPTRVVYYRRGSLGRRGKGPIQRMVIRSVRDRVIFEDAEPDVLVDIDLKLKL